MTKTINERLSNSPYFEDVVYIEGRHEILMNKNRYIGAWRSVNDLQAQLGPEKFNKFLKFIENKIKNKSSIKATYLTRSWTARRVD